MEFYSLTFYEFSLRVFNFKYKDQVQQSMFREVVTIVHNVNCSKPHEQRKNSEIWPLELDHWNKAELGKNRKEDSRSEEDKKRDIEDLIRIAAEKKLI